MSVHAAPESLARTLSIVPTQRRRGPKVKPAEVPLGSVVAPRPALWSCLNCGGTDVSDLPIKLTGKGTLTFVTCHECAASRWFDQSGAHLELVEVLDLITRTRANQQGVYAR